MAPRIAPAEVSGPMGSVVKRFSRRQLGRVPAAIGVLWHNRRVLTDMSTAGKKAKRWDAVADDLKAYAHMAAVAQVGCSFCLDFGFFEAEHQGMDMAKAREIVRWRESTAFTSLERDVIEYAEAMTATPPQVTDELATRLLDQLGAPGLVELTAWVAFANMASRANVALGIEAEGLSSSCPVLERAA
jgi:alkylhydroperoxidase family enzyme